MNKANQAALHEAKKAQRAADAAERAAAIEAAHAQARANALTAIDTTQVLRNQAEVRQVCKALTPQMVAILYEIASSPMQQAAGRVAAANAIIDRGFGKAVQPVTGLPGDVFDEMDDDALDNYLLRNTSKFIEGKVNEDVRQHVRGDTAGTDNGGTTGDAPAQDRKPTSGHSGKGRKLPKPAGAGARQDRPTKK